MLVNFSHLCCLALAALATSCSGESAISEDLVVDPQIAYEIEQLTAKTGANFEIVSFDDAQPNATIEIQNLIPLYQWETVHEALSAVPEDTRFLCGQSGIFSLAIKINYRTELPRDKIFKVIYPRDSTERSFNDPFQRIRTASPSPYLSYIIERKKVYSGPVFFENIEDEVSNQSFDNWNDQIQKLKINVAETHDKFVKGPDSVKAKLAMESARRLLTVFGMSDNWGMLFSQDRDSLATMAAIEAVEIASRLSGEDAVAATRILQAVNASQKKLRKSKQ